MSDPSGLIEPVDDFENQPTNDEKITNLACQWLGFLMAGNTNVTIPDSVDTSMRLGQYDCHLEMVAAEDIHVMGMLKSEAKEKFTQLCIRFVEPNRHMKPNFLFGQMVVSYSKPKCSNTMCFAAFTLFDYVRRPDFHEKMHVPEMFARSFRAKWMLIDDVPCADPDFIHFHRVEGENSADHLNVWEANGYSQPTLEQLQALIKSCGPIAQMRTAQKKLEKELAAVMESTDSKYRFKCYGSTIRDQLAKAPTLNTACHILQYYGTSNRSDDITAREVMHIWNSDIRPAVMAEFDMKTILNNKIVYVKCFETFDEETKCKEAKEKASINKCESAALRLYRRMQ